jgi:hypothetical protein
MDYLERLNRAVMKEKIHEKFIQGKITAAEMEDRIRAIGAKLKKKENS